MNRIFFLRLRICLSVLFLSLVSLLSAQGWEITGKVIEANTGEPVIGGNVLIVGTNTGTITDIDGNYSIRVRGAGDILEFSFIGMETKQVTVTDERTIDVSLAPRAEDIDEVVVIGYGTQKKEDLTGSISVVDAEELNKASTSTIDRALQGKAAGVNVISTSGMPGSGMTVRIRGIGSINANPNPLFVVDGVFVGGLGSINPADIESMQILKDASATAIYGARGANGVVIVTTKRGQQGKPKVNFNAYTGISQLTKRFDVMNADEYVDFYRTAYDQYLVDHPDDVGKVWLPEPYTDSARAVNGSADTDWQDQILQLGRNNNYSLSISGGGENSNFAVSGNYYNETGILIDTEFERFTLRANSDFNITDWLTIGESFAFNRSKTNESSPYTQGNPWVAATTASPLMPIYADALGGYAGPTDTITGVNEVTNPYAEQILNEGYNYGMGITANVYAELALTSHLKYKMSVGLGFNTSVSDDWKPKYDLGNLGNRDRPQAERVMGMTYGSSYLMENTLSYSNTFGYHNLTVLVGHTWQMGPGFSFNAVGANFSEPNLTVMNQAATPVDVGGTRWDHRMEGILGRVIYDYQSKYLLTASIRRDGSSNFGPSYKYGIFPSFSLGWKINEDLLQQVSQINMLKLRGGWGLTGNENIGSFRYLELINQPDKSQYAFGYDEVTYYGAASIWTHGNPNVHWEAAAMTNIGIDFNAFRNKLQVVTEYYYKKAKDMLVEIGLSSIYGKSYEANPWTNLGSVVNRGFETTVSWRKYEGDFHYNISGNFSTLKNEVLQLAGDGQPIIENNTTITQVGNSIGSFYGFVAEGIFQSWEEVEEHAEQETNTSPGDIKFKDVNRDGVVDDNDRIIIGKPIPDFLLGFNFDAEYKGIDFLISLQGAVGQEVYNAHRANYALASGNETAKDWNKVFDVFDYWSESNPTNSMTRISIIDENRNDRLSTWWIDDASYLRLKTVQIGYTFPASITNRLTVSNMRVYLSSTNLYTLTRYRGYDPEINSNNPLRSGIDGGSYPVPRTFLAGIQLNF